jgi:hypothetical protein
MLLRPPRQSPQARRRKREAQARWRRNEREGKRFFDIPFLTPRPRLRVQSPELSVWYCSNSGRSSNAGPSRPSDIKGVAR